MYTPEIMNKWNAALKICLVLLCMSSTVYAGEIDLSGGRLLVSPSLKSPVKETVIQVLQEEIHRRTGIHLGITDAWGGSPVIALTLSSDEMLNGKALPETLPEKTKLSLQAESFSVVVQEGASQPVIWLIGADERGLLFAAGHLLRTSLLADKQILFDSSNAIQTAPDYPIRGHQLGYRNTANSYDAWSKEQYEQYIRELAIFGTNCIETIPFDNTPSPHMKVSKEEMNRHISAVCKNYGLDYWVWTPANVDLSDESLFRAEVKKHSDYYRECPHLSHVFVPGGDPGDNHPRYVMPFLKAIAGELEKYHPQAGVWISLQGFSDEQIDYFYHFLETESPDWLRGVVSGPGSPPLSDTRYRLPGKYMHRHYADITHIVRCLYPTLRWDQAFALTLGREPANPQPFYYAELHDRYAPFTDGFLTYSDGAHDDLNKFIWSRKGWNKEEDAVEITEQYVRFFFGTKPDDRVTDAILGLERNWDGPIEANGGIEMTFLRWQQLEEAYPRLQNDWRWQMLLLRTYYDTYTKRRKLYEQGLEREASKLLEQSPAIGSEKAMELALEKVNEADRVNTAPLLRKKIEEYCEALYHSVGLQTSVEKYQASGPERGSVLDFVDYPLNNRWWLADQFEKIGRMGTEAEKLSALEVISTWENPGKGSYYDNISNISQSPRVKTTVYDATDVAWWDGGKSRKRLSTQLFQNAPQLVYEDLDPKARYLIRIAGYGDALLRVDGERISPTLYNKELEEFKEFPIDRRFFQDGKLEVSFDEPEESHLNWRQYSKVCDIWLIKIN
ncbi:hypothetical protein [uncultured Proteiniphilum sp.]|uniref:hypothetical protein n=1 Tax=uncultured Proteiniphilum sp. TaxID=497637 RepID=UPI00261A1247|nr:hypothetical protein [uncultured Proteiniphilum sp.]